MNQSDEKTDDPSDNQFASEVTLLSGLTVIFGIAAIFLSLWTAMVSSSGIENTIYLLRYVDGYRPAVFTIEKIKFFKARNTSKHTDPDKYWVEGDIEGKKERFGLGKYVPNVVQNQADLEKKVSVGQKLPVLYNPDVPESLEMRVQYPEKDFKQYVKLTQKKMIKATYLPWGISFCLCLFFGIIAKKAKIAIGLCIGSLLFILFGLIPTLVNLLTRP